MSRVTCPALVVAGDADPMTPPWMARRIVEAAGGRAELRIVRGGDHESTHLEREDGADAFGETMGAFLDRLGRDGTIPPADLERDRP
jgi:fermentation-respiration switch protein FrsA (DUF1100 family)